MAKKQGTLDPSADLARQQEKRDKKLAKREAKAMLEVDVAREKFTAAEKKLARAQLRLEARIRCLRGGLRQEAIQRLVLREHRDVIWTG